MARTKSILTQITEVLEQMAALSKEDKPDKVKAGLLSDRLSTLRYLHQQEVADEHDTLVAENETLKKRVAELSVPREPTDAEIQDAIIKRRVAAMVAEKAAAAQTPTPAPTPVRVATLTRDEGTSHIAMPRSRPVEDDLDGFIT